MSTHSPPNPRTRLRMLKGCCACRRCGCLYKIKLVSIVRGELDKISHLGEELLEKRESVVFNVDTRRFSSSSEWPHTHTYEDSIKWTW